MDLEKKIVDTASAAVDKAVYSALTEGYQAPLKELSKRVLDRRSEELERQVDSALTELIGGVTFRESLRSALRDKLAKTLVSRMGGELERRINELKANPATRARITLALEKMIDEITSPRKGAVETGPVDIPF